MNISQVFKLVLAVAACVLVGSVSGYFTAGEIDTWYATLEKPSFNPPNWIFAPVWTLLYVLMGVAFFYFWTTPSDKSKKQGYLAFVVQLVLNFFWSFFFFKLHAPTLALVEILFLLAAILTTLFLFMRVSGRAAALMLPYLAWVVFATFLNAAIMQLN